MKPVTLKGKEMTVSDKIVLLEKLNELLEELDKALRRAIIKTFQQAK